MRRAERCSERRLWRGLRRDARRVDPTSPLAGCETSDADCVGGPLRGLHTEESVVSREGPRIDPLRPPSRSRGTPSRDGGQAGAAVRDDGGRIAGWESSAAAVADSETIDPAELRDFLAADFAEEKSDPVFKERLRELLWQVVKRRYGTKDEGGRD